MEVTIQDLGRVFLLDMLLGNPDRLPCKELSWRGNRENLLYGFPPNADKERLIAIDSCVPRKPPAAKVTKEDEAVQRMAELVIHDMGVAEGLLGQAVEGSAVTEAVFASEDKKKLTQTFQEGLKMCLRDVLKIQVL